ncbi:MAG: PQQ-binding-like beta-propeller repeat protein [Pirellulales bacterium]
MMVRNFLLLLLFCFVQVEANAEQWPQFRGPNSTGLSLESRNLPIEFSYQDKVLWSANLGEGIACPVVSQGKVCATAMLDNEKFAVFCFDASSGQELWRREFETGELPAIMSPNTPASSTPAVDGQRVYVYFSTLGLMALDLSDGQTIWNQSVPKPQYLMGWGAAHSPIVHNEMLIFNQDDDLSPFLLALDKQTGKVLWKTDRPEMLAGYSIPVICRAGQREDIVVAGSGKLKGYNPKTGEERWTCNTLLRTIMTTPAVVDDTIYVSLQSYGDTNRVLKFALLEWKDTNQDGRLEKSEVGEPFWEKFDQGDKNQDGFLVDEEIDRAFQTATNMAGGGSTIQAVRGGGVGDVTATHLQWNLDYKVPSNIVSPLVVNGRLLVVKKGGISACFDTQVGATLWMKKRIGNLGNYYASPVAGDGKIYVMGENGFLTVLEQGPKLKVLAKNDMGESCTATPAIADDRIFVRTQTKLYCFSEEAK